MSVASTFLEKIRVPRWTPNNIGGEKATVVTRLGIEFVIHINKHYSGYSWLLGRYGDKYVSSGGAPSAEQAKSDALMFVKGMEQRGIA